MSTAKIDNEKRLRQIMKDFLARHKFASEKEFDSALYNFIIDVEGGSMKMTKVENGTRLVASVLFDILYDLKLLGSIKPVKFDGLMKKRLIDVFGEERCSVAKNNRTISNMNLHLLLSDSPVHFSITCSHRYRKEILKLS